jgi:hypothetical protein
LWWWETFASPPVVALNLLFEIVSIDRGVTELGFGWMVDALLAKSPCCPPLTPVLSLRVNGSQHELPDTVEGYNDVLRKTIIWEPFKPLMSESLICQVC